MASLEQYDPRTLLKGLIAQGEDLLSLFPLKKTILSPTKHTQEFNEEYDLLTGKRVSGLPLAEMQSHRNHQIKITLRKIRRSLARAVFWGRGDSYSDELLGLMEIMRRIQEDRWNPYTYRDMNNCTVGLGDIDELLYRLYRHNGVNYSLGDWRVVAGPRIVEPWYWDTLLPIHRPGPDDTRFIIDNNATSEKLVLQSKLGRFFPIVVDENIRSDVVMAINTLAFSYGFVDNSKLQIRTVEKTRTVERKELSFQAYGLVPLEDPRKNLGMLYDVGVG